MNLFENLFENLTDLLDAHAVVSGLGLIGVLAIIFMETGRLLALFSQGARSPSLLEFLLLEQELPF